MNIKTQVSVKKQYDKLILWHIARFTSRYGKGVLNYYDKEDIYNSCLLTVFNLYEKNEKFISKGIHWTIFRIYEDFVRRKEFNYIPSECVYNYVADNGYDPLEEMLKKDYFEKLDEIIKTLPDFYKLIYNMRTKKYTQKRIGEVIGKTQTCVNGYLRRIDNYIERRLNT